MFVSIAYAQEETMAPEELFSDWVGSDDSFKIGKIKLNSLWVEPNAFITFEDTSLNIPLGECRYSSPFDICFNDTRQLLNGDVLPEPINSDDVDTEMLIKVYGKLARLELSRSFEKSKLLINEEATVSVEIKNSGLAEATDIDFEDDYPSAVEVKKISGCDIINNKAVWTGSLRKENSHKCEYRIKALKDKSFVSTATLEYFNAVEQRKLSDTIHLTILENVIKPSIELSKTKLTIGDILTIHINLSNNHNETVDISKFLVQVPGSLKILDKGGLSDVYGWKGSILADESRDFMITAQAVRTGEYNISLYTEYLASGVRQNASEKKRFRTGSDLDIETIENLDEQRPIGKTSNLLIKVLNPSTEKPLLDIKADISSDLPGIKNLSIEKEFLGRNNEMVVLDTDYTPDQAGEYYLNMTISYKSEFDEVFVKTLSKVIRIGAQGSAVAGTGTISSPNETTGAAASSQVGKKSKIFNIKMPRLPSMSSLLQLSTDEGRTAGMIMIGAVVILGLLLFYVKHKIRSD